MSSERIYDYLFMVLVSLAFVLLLPAVAQGAEPDWQSTGFAIGASVFTIGLWAAARLYRNRW